MASPEFGVLFSAPTNTATVYAFAESPFDANGKVRKECAHGDGIRPTARDELVAVFKLDGTYGRAALNGWRIDVGRVCRVLRMNDAAPFTL